MNHLKYFENQLEKLYKEYDMCYTDQIFQGKTISSSSIEYIKKMFPDIKFGIEYIVSFPNPNLSLKFKYNVNGKSKTIRIISLEDEYFVVKMPEKYYIVDGYDGLKQFFADKIIDNETLKVF